MRRAFSRTFGLLLGGLVGGGLGAEPPPVLALDPRQAITQYIHDVWQTEQGLPQNTVTDIVQSRDGYLWLGTFGGLVRFDGIKFTIVGAETQGLKSSRILSLCEDWLGNLWIGTEHGGLTRYGPDGFTTYTEKDGLPSNWVDNLFVDRLGNLWIGSGKGLTRWQGGQLTTYTMADGLPDNGIQAVAEDRAGTLWIGTRRGLAQLRRGVFTALTTRDGLPADDITALLEDHTGNIWIGTGNGLARIHQETIDVYTTAQGLTHNRITDLIQDRDGNVWIGTWNGLTRWSDGRFATFAPGDGLSGQIVRSILEDREGNLWMGVTGGGLNRLKEGKLIAYTSGLTSEGTVPITEDGEGGLWVGATCGGLLRLRDGHFMPHLKSPQLANDCIWSLHRDRAGRLWIGTWGGGLMRLEQGRLMRYTTEQGLSSNNVFAILEDAVGQLWIGTSEGLNRFDGNRFTVYTTRDGLVRNDVRFLMQDRQGALWIGTVGGFSRFDAGRFTSFTPEDGLSHGYVRAIYEDAEGILWIGTYGGGLNRFDGRTFTSYTTTVGLFDDVVSRILEDRRGNLWMSGNRGIFQVSRRELNDFAEGKIRQIQCASYATSEGMKSRECNGGGQPAGWQTRDGKLWFPTADGVTMIDPDHLAANQVPPPVHIEQVLLDGRPIATSPQVEIPPGNTDLEISYTGLSFVTPGKVRFKYKLEGYNQDWVDAGTRRVAYYTKIPPGSYRFRVIAANNDGVWNETGASLELSLQPHFYQTTWFYGLVAVGVGLVGWGINRLRVRQLVRRTRDLETRVSERTSELERANQELEMMDREKSEFLAIAAHDLRPPLVNLKGFVGELRSAMESVRAGLAGVWSSLDERQRREMTTLLDEEVPEALGFIDSSVGRMDQLIAAILKLSRLGRRELFFEPIDMNEVVRTTLKTLAYQVEQQQVKVTVQPLPKAIADQTSVEMIMANILANAIHYLVPGRVGEVEISGETNEQETTIHVRDNGRGISSDEVSRIFKVFGRAGKQDVPGEGMGLTYVQILIQRHGGRIWCQSTPGVGTTFSFALPHRRKYRRSRW